MLSCFSLLLVLSFYTRASLLSRRSPDVVDAVEPRSGPLKLTYGSQLQLQSQSQPTGTSGLHEYQRRRDLVRRLRLFGGCQDIERAYLERMLNGDARGVLNAGAHTASSRGLWSRRKFREYFGVYTTERAEEVRNWLMHVEIERGLTPRGNLEIYCRRDETDEDPRCEWLIFGYVWRWAPNELILCPRFWHSLAHLDGNGEPRLFDPGDRGEKYMLRVLLALLLETAYQPFIRHWDDEAPRPIQYITVQGFRPQLFTTRFIPGSSNPETKIADPTTVMEYAIFK